MKSIIERKIELLTTPIWTTKDIQDYFQVSRTTAFAIKSKIINAWGNSSCGDKYVKRDYVLTHYAKTTAEDELNKIKGLIENDTKEEL